MSKILPLLLFCLSTTLSAQKSDVGLYFGFNNYLGDLVLPSVSLKNPNLTYGAFYHYHVNKNLSAKANILLGKLSGADANYAERAFRDYSFETNITELSAVLEWNITGKDRWDAQGFFTKNSSPYLLAGVGVVMSKPKVSGLPANSPDLVEDFSTSNLIIPAGFGYKFDLSERLRIGVEYSFRISLTDYLDGISVSGNPDANDWYSLLGLNICYFLGQPK